MSEIIIDESRGLVFSSEEEVLAYFSEDVERMEKELFQMRKPEDISIKDFDKYERYLNKTIDDPDEIWEYERTENDIISVFIKKVKRKTGDNSLYHVALAYANEESPQFIYLHFPTEDEDLVERYRKGTLVYDEYVKNAPLGSLEGDALLEGDEMALGLYHAMIKLRDEDDIQEKDFIEYSDCREATIKDADEVWSNTDSCGQNFVHFIKKFKKDTEFYYVVIATESTSAEMHFLLFSFPTKDEGLVARYRIDGQSLWDDDVVIDAAH